MMQPSTRPTGALFFAEYAKDLAFLNSMIPEAQKDRVIIDSLRAAPPVTPPKPAKTPVNRDRSKAKAARKARKAQRRK